MSNPNLGEGGIVTANLNPRGQTLEVMEKIVAGILGHVGCPACGRVAILRFEFMGDPPVKLANEFVISLQTQGFGRG